MYAITAAVLGGCAERRAGLAGSPSSPEPRSVRLFGSTVIFSDLSVYWTFTVTGLVLLAAVVADALDRKYRERH